MGHYITERLNWRFSKIGEGPVWYADKLPWMAQLDQNRHIVLEEYQRFRDSVSNLPDVQQIRPDGTKDKVYQGRWSFIYLMIAGEKNQFMMSHFPKTMQLFEENVPELHGIRFSLLESDRKEIHQHRDGHGHTIVCHFPLIIPEGRCSVFVEGNEHPWQVGNSFTIDTSKQHYVQKESNEERLVVLISFFRPVPRIISTLSKFIMHRNFRFLPVEKMFGLHNEVLRKNQINVSSEQQS